MSPEPNLHRLPVFVIFEEKFDKATIRHVSPIPQLYMKKLIFPLLSWLFASFLQAQTYTPIDTANFEIRTDQSKQYLELNKTIMKSILAELKGGERSYVNKSFEQIHQTFNKDILKGQYIFNTPFTQIIEKIVTEICSKHTEIPNGLRFYLSKNIALNASSLGDNTFTVNMGAFYYLQNEDQLAGIIAHELAHLLLKHEILSMKTNFTLNKKEVPEELKEIHANNNSGQRAFDSYKKIMYNVGKLNQRQEIEADSLGYILYRQTKYNKPDYLNALKLIAVYDTIKPDGLKTATYRNFFSIPGQPFREEWLKKEDFSNYDYSKFNNGIAADSVKTHPDTRERITCLEKYFPELRDSIASVKASSDFEALSRIARLEQPAIMDFDEKYGFGIYICLHWLQADSSDVYYRQWLGRFLRKVYLARKSYTLNRYLDRVAPKEQTESYQQFLNIMWNFSLSEIKNLADYYSAESDKAKQISN